MPLRNGLLNVRQTFSPREIEKVRTRYSPYSTKNHLSATQPELIREIGMRIEWHGAFLKKNREAYKISIEELSNTTKITKTYINAIETDSFIKLPAAVYVRGFITQISKALRLSRRGCACFI
jgi:hypothetical protein